MAITSTIVPQLYGGDLTSVTRWAQQMKVSLETTLAEVQATTRDTGNRVAALQSATRLQLTLTVNAIATATWTTVSWDSASFDDKKWFSTGHKSRITVGVAGRYRVRALTAFDTASASVFGIAIAVNGTRVTFLQGSSVAVAIEDLIALNANDFLEVQVYQSTGGSVNLFATATQSYFCAERVL